MMELDLTMSKPERTRGPEVSRANKLDLSNEFSVVRGTFFGIIGTVAGTGLGFVAQIVLARALGPDEYGIWALTVLILNFCVMIAGLGLRQGITRFIGLHRGNQNVAGVAYVAWVGLGIVLITSLGMSLLVFGLAPLIARILEMLELSPVIQIAVWAVIPSTLLSIFIAVLRGYEDIRLATLVQTFIRSLLWLGAIAIVLLIAVENANAAHVAWIYLSVQIIVLLIAIILVSRHEAGSNIAGHLSDFGLGSLQHSKPLLVFSIPLLLSGFTTFVWTQSDKFMLGYFLSARDVGSYNVAFQVARLSPIFFLALGSIFLPVISKVIAQGDYTKIQDIYFRVTKWGLLASSLIILPLFVFPNALLEWFGPEYTNAFTALRFLLISYLIQAITGPNGTTLVALGQTKFIAYYTLLGATMNVGVNWYLIPLFGIEGAAFASVASVFVMNLLAFWWLYHAYRISPFNWGYTFLGASVIVLAIGGALIVDITHISNLFLPIFLVGVIAIEAAIVRSLHLWDEKDRAIWVALVNKAKGTVEGNG